MREIKFRAWDKEKGMYEMTGIKLPNTTDPSRHLGVVIMQYTGLHDKNRKEIYEGDIVKVGTRRYEDEKKSNIAEIRFYRGGFMLFVNGYFGGRDIEMFDGDCEKHEVIGNIYENPDLLNNK